MSYCRLGEQKDRVPDPYYIKTDYVNVIKFMNIIQNFTPNRKKTQKVKKKKKKTSFPKEQVEKAHLYTRAEQNNDHKRKMHKAQCRSSFKI